MLAGIFGKFISNKYYFYVGGLVWWSVPFSSDLKRRNMKFEKGLFAIEKHLIAVLLCIQDNVYI